MKNKTLITLSAAVFTAGLAASAVAQAPAQPAAQQPMFATTKVEGTDNVYVFRYQNHQAMFIVTPAGVIVTDPISYGRPQAAKAYLDEIRKITQAPIKYLIYSHHHYDHIAGGKVFKDAGATLVSHRKAKERLAQLKGRSRRHSRSGGRRQAHDQARRHDPRPHLHGSQSFGLFAGDAAAEREDPLCGGLQFPRRGAVAARGERLLSDRMGSFAEKDARARLGAR